MKYLPMRVISFHLYTYYILTLFIITRDNFQEVKSKYSTDIFVLYYTYINKKFHYLYIL